MIAGINRLDNTDHTINEVVKKPVILVVDDQPENIDVLSNILRDAYKVKAAINGEQALQIIQEKQAPDLILLDVMMPGIDGYEVCKKLKDNARSKSIPVIFVSALQNISDRVTAFAVGGVDYITKPVQSEEVLARVRAHVQIKMMQEQLEQSNEELEIRVKQRTLEVEAAYSELHESYRQILESEAKYRSLMDAAPDAVILADDGGHIEMVNQEASRLFGYSAEELNGKLIEILIPQDVKNHESFREEYINNSHSRGQLKNQRLCAIKKDGSEFPVDISLSPVKTKEGDKIIVDIRDISEREQLYTQLQQAQKMESIGHLTGGIAHDFNNMLASIMGFTELAISNCDHRHDEKLNEYLTEVMIAGERARELIAQMLSFSRRNNDREYAPLDASLLLKEVVSMIRPMLPSSIDINYNFEPDTPYINADPVQIHQILMNMCINARDALQGHGRVELNLKLVKFEKSICSSCHDSISGEYVVFEVTDNGTGIDESSIKNIFDPFFTTKEVGKGTGMGLSVVHGIVHDHNGHIVVKSDLGKGTIFNLLFPVN